MPETIADELLVNIRLKTEALEEGLAQMRSLLAKSSAQVEKLSTWQVTRWAVKKLANQTLLLSPLCLSFLPLLVHVGKSWSTWYSTSNLRSLATGSQSTMGRKTFTLLQPYPLEMRG